jgi:hypothetical protein
VQWFPTLFLGTPFFLLKTIATQFTIGLIYKIVRRSNVCINENSWTFLLPIPRPLMYELKPAISKR